MEHYRKLERMYYASPINDYFKPVLHVGEGEAEVSIVVREDFHHAAGGMHGCVYFKALRQEWAGDTTSWAAAWLRASRMLERRP